LTHIKVAAFPGLSCFVPIEMLKSEKKMLKFKNIARLHFALLILILFNLTLNTAFGVGISNNILIATKLVLYLSGIFLFFVHVKPFKAIAIYFSFFLMTPIVIAIFYFMHGLFFALLSSLFLTPIMPLESEYSESNVKVYSKFNGFLGRCCSYYVTQNILFVFEEHVGNIDRQGPMDFKTSKFTLRSDSILIESDTVYRIKRD
jgi:hypothetical protein